MDDLEFSLVMRQAKFVRMLKTIGVIPMKEIVKLDDPILEEDIMTIVSSFVHEISSGRGRPSEYVYTEEDFSKMKLIVEEIRR